MKDISFCRVVVTRINSFIAELMIKCLEMSTTRTGTEKHWDNYKNGNSVFLMICLTKWAHFCPASVYVKHMMSNVSFVGYDLVWHVKYWSYHQWEHATKSRVETSKQWSLQCKKKITLFSSIFSACFKFWLSLSKHLWNTVPKLSFFKILLLDVPKIYGIPSPKPFCWY